MLLKNAQIYTMEEEQVIKGDILIQNGRIAAIGHVETEDEVCIDWKTRLPGNGGSSLSFRYGRKCHSQ